MMYKPNTMQILIYIPILLSNINLHNVKAFTFTIQTKKHKSIPFAKKNKWMHESPSNTPKEIKRPINEFSRIVRIDSVLSSGSSASRNARNYNIFIEAKKEELEGLAKRFQLPDIGKLEADLVLRKDSGTKSGTSSKGELIQAEGTVTAILTQKCTRTNTPFETDLSFHLFAAVRTSGSRDDVSNLSPPSSNFRPRKKKRQKIDIPSTVDELSMQEIQGIIGDIDLEDDIIEDDAVFSGGNFDVGELVAQMFRLKLDPFPKKPGSSPVDITFTG